MNVYMTCITILLSGNCTTSMKLWGWGYTGFRVSIRLSVDAILYDLLLIQFWFNFVETLYESLRNAYLCTWDFHHGRTAITEVMALFHFGSLGFMCSVRCFWYLQIVQHATKESFFFGLLLLFCINFVESLYDTL